MKTPPGFVSAACLFFFHGSILAQAPSPTPILPSDVQNRPAAFTVTKDVLNANVEPFTITVAEYGNSLKLPGKGGFEPFSFRNRLKAGRNSPDRIYDDNNISAYDTFASGYLDGADVRIYRPVDGRLKLVRADKVANGGTVIENWYMTSAILSPEASTAAFRWASYTTPGAERWYTIFAINKDGVPSTVSETVKLSFVKSTSDITPENQTTNFQAPQNPTGVPVLTGPTNIRAVTDATGLVQMTWTRSLGDVAAYRIGYTDVDPATHRGTYLQLSRQPATPEEAIKTDDMIIVAKEMPSFKIDWLSSRVGGIASQMQDRQPYGVPNMLLYSPGSWRIVNHPAGTPVQEAGKTYLELTLTDGQVAMVGRSSIADIGSSSQTYYNVPESVEYTMEVWMKADRANANPVVFTYHDDARVGGFIQPYSMQVDTTWKKYTRKFMGASSATGNPTTIVLKATGAGVFSFDNFRVYRSDTAYLDYEQKEYNRLRDSGMMAFRTHSPIKTGSHSYSMEQFTGPQGSVEGVLRGTSLGGMLSTIKNSGLRPWLQIEYHMSPEEWLGFAEFMAAPYDPTKDTPQSKPWAYKRYTQGRQAPWTDAFDRIYFELSNETWNSLFSPWTFPNLIDASGNEITGGAVYGKLQDEVVGILRSSPYWTKEVNDKFVNVMGGWAGSTFNNSIAANSKTGDFITIAAYNGGWDAGEGPPKTDPPSYFYVLNFANQSAIPGAQALLGSAIKWETGNGRRFGIGTYEAGPGYALNGLNGTSVTAEQAAQQELVMKSKLAGVATIDTFLSQAAYDFDLQNFFTFGEGTHWKSHAKSYVGGAAHPSFLYLSLFNKFATGDLLKVTTESTPTVDLPAIKRRKAVDNAPSAAAYATRKGNQVNLFVISRRYPNFPEGSGDGFTPFEITLPFTKATKITLHRLTGAPEDTNTLGTEKVRHETINIPVASIKTGGKFAVDSATGGDARGLPPTEAYLYVFEGTDIGAPGKTLSRWEILGIPEPPPPPGTSDDFNNNEGTAYSGWTEINFTDGGLPLYTEVSGRLEWNKGGDEDDHVTINNASAHGPGVAISVDVKAYDSLGSFYIYFFYQDANNWYRLNVSETSSKFQKRINGVNSQIGASGAGANIAPGGAAQTWRVEAYSSGRLKFLSGGFTILEVSGIPDLASGKAGLGGIGRRPVWDNFKVEASGFGTSDNFNDGEGTAYTGWTERNFTDSGLPLYTESNGRLEWNKGGDEDNHVTLNNASTHGPAVSISADVGAQDSQGTFYVYLFYQDDNNWYRLSVDGTSSKFQKRINGVTSQIGTDGVGLSIPAGGALQNWRVEAGETGSLRFIVGDVTVLNISGTRDLTGGKVGLGGINRRPVWDNFQVTVP